MRADLRPYSALALFLAALLIWASGRMAWAQSPAGGLEPLTIATGQGPQRFQVEVARDDATRTQGLMYRRSLPPDYGMLFDFKVPTPVTMWMKNTYIPLDMVFIRADGTIARIAENTEPLSTRIIPAGEPVTGVLELAGGTARARGIRPGDKVEHPIFGGR